MANTGLFSTPEQVIAAQQQAQAAQDPNTALRAALMGAGRAASGAFGRGLGAAPPPESEAVKQARIATNILQTSPLETKQDYFKAAQKAGEAGNIQLKMKLASLGAAIKAPEAAKKSASLIKTEELIARNVPPEQAEGIGYGAYRVVKDEETGDMVITDLRQGGARVSDEVAEQVSPHLPASPYIPRVVTKGDKPERLLQNKVQSLSKDIIKTGAPKLEGILDTVEAIINKTYGPEGKGDLPGYGITSALPDWAVSQDAQNLRQSAVKMFNIELAERSGAAVTKQELDRLRDEFKQGAWRTDRQFVEGVKQYRNLLEDYKQAVVAGYDPSVVSRYTEQGGVRLRKQKPTITPKVDKPKITEAQIRADAKKHGWSKEQTNSAIKKYVR